MENFLEERMAYNAIAIHTFGSYAAIKKIKGAYATWREAWNALATQVTALPDPVLAWERLARAEVQLILLQEKDYPPPLREIPHAPFGIYIRGNANGIAGDGAKGPPTFIGVVGTRRASIMGKETAKRFAHELTQTGCGIVSGLAFGIDAAAHEGCLEAGGITVAVFAGGLEHIYPHSHRRLAEKILINRGALVSEYPLTEEPRGYRFIERNRIVSGLSRGVIVIEAPEDSGSLATARFALEQNRDVFVVPGNIFQDNFKGSHSLIRQGATLVTDTRDIFESYDLVLTPSSSASYSGATPEEMLVLTALAGINGAIDVDKILEITRLEPRIANQTLSFLLIKNLIREVDGRYTI